MLTNKYQKYKSVDLGDYLIMSRARLSLGILLCCQNQLGRTSYKRRNPGYRAAIEEGLVLVATPPWHPQVTFHNLKIELKTLFSSHPWRSRSPLSFIWLRMQTLLILNNSPGLTGKGKGLLKCFCLRSRCKTVILPRLG